VIGNNIIVFLLHVREELCESCVEKNVVFSSKRDFSANSHFVCPFSAVNVLFYIFKEYKCVYSCIATLKIKVPKGCFCSDNIEEPFLLETYRETYS